MKNFINKFKDWWNRCDHRFRAKEVADLTFDPKCVKCGKSLSDICKAE